MVWQRCFVLIVVMPGSYVGSITAVFLPVAAVGFFGENHPAAAALLLVAEAALLSVLYGFARFTRAITAASRRKDIAIEAIILPRNERERTGSEEN